MKLEQNELEYFLHLLKDEIFNLSKHLRYEVKDNEEIEQASIDLKYAINMLKKLSEVQAYTQCDECESEFHNPMDNEGFRNLLCDKCGDR
tara:strand:- start:209 stop:478 length:270 start_codon:yes stop_codon:yes gene_type:complete